MSDEIEKSLRARLAEREEFIRMNAGPLLAERDAKIERQRAELQRITEKYAQLKLNHATVCEEIVRLREEIVHIASGNPRRLTVCCFRSFEECHGHNGTA